MTDEKAPDNPIRQVARPFTHEDLEKMVELITNLNPGQQVAVCADPDLQVGCVIFSTRQYTTTIVYSYLMSMIAATNVSEIQAALDMLREDLATPKDKVM